MGECSENDVTVATCNSQTEGREIWTGADGELKPLSEPPAQGQSVALSERDQVATIQGRVRCGHDVQREVSVNIFRCERILRRDSKPD
jgi:hypothetical protein